MVEALRADGHDVLYAVETMQGATDDQILEIAFEQHRLLVTEDKDFGELVVRQRKSSHGVVLVRLPGFSGAEKAEFVVTAVTAHGEELAGAFTVITSKAVRVRRSPS